MIPVWRGVITAISRLPSTRKGLSVRTLNDDRLRRIVLKSSHKHLGLHSTVPSKRGLRAAVYRINPLLLWNGDLSAHCSFARQNVSWAWLLKKWLDGSQRMICHSRELSIRHEGSACLIQKLKLPTIPCLRYCGRKPQWPKRRCTACDWGICNFRNPVSGLDTQLGSAVANGKFRTNLA